MADPWAWRSDMDAPQPRNYLAPTLKPGPAPTGYDRVFDTVYNYLGGTPDKRPVANALAAAFDVGTLGMATGAYDGARELATTGRPAALAMALMPGARVAAPAARGIRAFHGSPHDFDRFDITKIGTGEGAQAYGHGLYFAENEQVARDYRNKLSGKPVPASQSQAQAYRGAVLAKLQGQGVDIPAAPEMVSPGRLYEVRIDAEPEDFLDWDRPLDEQSDVVKRIIEPVLRKAAAEIGQGASAEKIAQFEAMGLKNIADRMRPKQIDPWSLDVATLAKEYPNALREAGIKGIRYLDQASRGAGEGSRNYVVMDDALIEIMRKYGLVPPALAGAYAASSEPAEAN